MSSGGGEGGDLPDDCDDISEEASYIGCEYWPTVTRNGTWSEYFSFAAVVVNASNRPANIEVTRGGAPVAAATVEVGDLGVIELPWVDELKGVDFDDATNYESVPGGEVVPGGAYRLVSDRPVTVYQFSALFYEAIPTPAGCPDVIGDGGCYSFSNDASLLLPTTALSGDYVTTGWSGGEGRENDLLAVTATQDGTTVTIVPTDNANGTGIDLMPGSPTELQMNAGDVVQVVSDDTGFPGTFVTADKPVQVISGHPCANVPDDGTQACDHIEEAVTPVQAFGTDHIVTTPITPDGVSVHAVRIHAIRDGTALEFDPAVNPPVTLNQGESLDLVEIEENFQVKSTEAFGVTQYMYGEGSGIDSPIPLPGFGPGAGAGDPSQSTVVATEQFQDEYIFLAPPDYDQNFVNVVAPMGAEIELDGAAIPNGSFAAVGGSGMGMAQMPLGGDGVHVMKGTEPFGITVYGYGRFTSYMYPGGAAVREITIPPPPPG